VVVIVIKACKSTKSRNRKPNGYVHISESGLFGAKRWHLCSFSHDGRLIPAAAAAAEHNRYWLWRISKFTIISSLIIATVIDIDLTAASVD